jgi:uncharacterized protein (TIRG00374 family)
MILRTIKLVVSAGLILILVWNVDWSEIHSNLSKLNTTLAVAAVLILILQYPLSAWKWQKSLALHGVKYPLGYLLRILCIAFFFNNFLPSAIGGDTYRAYRTFGHASRYAYPISAVIVERVLGLFALIFFGYMSAVVLVATGAFEFKKELTIISVGLILGAILLLAFWKIGFLERLSHRLRGLSKLEPVWESARAVRANRRHLVTLVGLSLLFQFLAIVSITLLFSALNLPGRFFESGFTAAAAGVAGMIPLSINGIGIVEGSFAVTAVIAKLPYGDAVIVALFIRIFGLASSVIFGILYAFDRNTSMPSKKANTEK